MAQAGYTNLDYKLYFEPEGGINTPREFTDALVSWSNREHKQLVILEESMEPLVEVDGKRYVCRLADPLMGRQKNPLFKALNIQGYTHSVGPMLGYQWVYLYEA